MRLKYERKYVNGSVGDRLPIEPIDLHAFMQKHEVSRLLISRMINVDYATVKRWANGSVKMAHCHWYLLLLLWGEYNYRQIWRYRRNHVTDLVTPLTPAQPRTKKRVGRPPKPKSEVIEKRKEANRLKRQRELEKRRLQRAKQKEKDKLLRKKERDKELAERRKQRAIELEAQKKAKLELEAIRKEIEAYKKLPTWGEITAKYKGNIS